MTPTDTGLAAPSPDAAKPRPSRGRAALWFLAKLLVTAGALAFAPGRLCSMYSMRAPQAEPSPTVALTSAPVSGEITMPMSRMPAPTRLSMT